MISVDENAVLADCSTFEGTRVLSLTEMAEINGLSTGVISTARLTHATPAVAYAHSPSRGYEYTAPKGCTDIGMHLEIYFSSVRMFGLLPIEKHETLFQGTSGYTYTVRFFAPILL